MARAARLQVVIPIRHEDEHNLESERLVNQGFQPFRDHQASQCFGITPVRILRNVTDLLALRFSATGAPIDLGKLLRLYSLVR